MPENSPVTELVSIRDWLRYAITRFERAQLVYGHGTATALDEAAFLILASLELPVDSLDPWLDCRLTLAERETIAHLISERIATRKPAPYLTRCAFIQGHKFYVDERAIVPRSYIGELICRDSLASAIADPAAVTRVLDLCTGSGCLAILAALAFPEAHVTASDVSLDALAVARKNLENYRLEGRLGLVQSDLFAALPAARYDLIISNPPYVTESAVDAFPPEYRAEPRLAHDGGADGLDLVKRILERAPEYLSTNGVLVVETGDARDALEAARPDLPFIWLDTETSEGEVFMLAAADFAHHVPGKRKVEKSGVRTPSRTR